MSKIVMEEWGFEVPVDQPDTGAFIEKKVMEVTGDADESEYIRVSCVFRRGEDLSVEVTVEKDIADMTVDELIALRDQLNIQLDEFDETEPDEDDEDYGEWMMSVDETERLMEEVIATLAEIGW